MNRETLYKSIEPINNLASASLQDRLASSAAVQFLMQHARWVAWKYEERGGARTKPPINPKTGDRASVSDPTTWGSYNEAIAYVVSGRAEGVGIVLTGTEGIVGIDLDDCLREDGTPDRWVQNVLDLNETYAEISPSGRGIRMLAVGKLDKAVKDAIAGVELYDRGRYLTITGNGVSGAPDAIREAPRTLKHLHARVTDRKVEHALSTEAASLTRKSASRKTGDFYRNVNEAALNNLGDWVPSLLPMATSSSNGYRVSSHDLGRDYQEDLSVTTQGIVDFGPADQGDAQEGRRTAIDLVIEHAEEIGLEMLEIEDDEKQGKAARRNAENASAAANWLCEQMHISPWDLGKVPKHASDWLSFLNERHAVVIDSGRTSVVNYEFDYQTNPPRKRVELMSFPSFKDAYSHKKIDITITSTSAKGDSRREVTNEQQVSVGRWWLENEKRRQYQGITFAPGMAREINGHLNLWEGFAVQATKGDWSLMRWHVENVLASGDSELSSYILKWCAYAIQFPMEPAEAALVLKGKKGTGKGTLGNALAKIFGQHAHRINHANHLVGNFNAHLRDTVLLFCDEAYWPGNKGAEGTLKALITEPSLFIEAKGKDGRSVKNMLHIVMASNELWVVPAGSEERRYFVVEVSDCRIQDKDYFHRLNKQLNEGGLSAMLFDLQQVELTGWHPRNVLMTDALIEQQNASMSVEDSWWETKIQDGYIVGANSLRPDWIASMHLKSDFLAFSQKLYHYNDKSFGSLLTGYGCVKGKKTGNANTWFLPNLHQARMDFSKRYKGTVWENPDQTEWGTPDDAVDDLQMHLFGRGHSEKSSPSSH